MILSRLRGAFIGVVLAAACAAHARTPEEQAAALDAIAHGRAPSVSVTQAPRAASKAVSRPERTEGRSLREAMRTVASAVAARRAGNAGDDAVRNALEQLRIADAAMTAVLDDADKRLHDTNADGTYTERSTEARQRLRARIDAIYQALGMTGGMAQSAPATYDTASLDRAAALLVDLVREPSAQILRASTLPVSPMNLPLRTPVLSPTVAPAYLTLTEVASTPADIAAGPEGPFADELLAKAKDLGYDYVRIFEFVRNQVTTEWYAGSQKGALGVLRSLAGNDVDQAALLVALLRASGAPARYVSGVIELPVATLAAQMGITDTTLVADALGRAGIAYTPVVQGGRVALVRMEHTWVTALVPYTNYRGVALDNTGRTWLPLDVWFKRISGLAATPAIGAGALTASSLASGYASSDTDFMSYVRNTVTAALPAGRTYDQARGSSSVVTQQLDLLPNTLPYTVIAITRENPALDRSMVVNAELRLVAGTDTALDVSYPVHMLVNDRVTLSYDAATVPDFQLTLGYGGIDATPAYLIRVRPQVRIGGQLKAVPTLALTPGIPATFTVTLTGPFGTRSLDQSLTVGAYHVLGFAAGDLTRPAVNPGDQEADAARLLDGAAQYYVHNWKAAEDELALLTGVVVARPLPSVVMVNNFLRADTFANVSFGASWRGVTIDAMTRPSEPAGAARNDWMDLASLEGSSLEQRVFADLFKVDAVSADRVLALAGSPVSINATNVDAQLGATTQPSSVQDEIRNWVRQGFVVKTHANPLTRNAWSGSAWIVTDPTTHAAGYFLSGTIAGGSTTPSPGDWALDFLAAALGAPHGNTPDTDSLAAASVLLVSATDGQTGTVGKPLDKQLAVVVRNASGQPVRGAKVTFTSTRGGGTFDGAGSSTTTTDASGTAQATFTLGKTTDESPTYAKRNASDKYAFKIGQNFVAVSVTARSGAISPNEPFNAFAFPDDVATLDKTYQDSGSAGAGAALVLVAKDQYGNRVANADVQFSGGSGTSTCDPPGAGGTAQVGDQAKCPSLASYGACGSGSVTITSGTSGTVSSWVYLPYSFAANYTVNATSSGKSTTAQFTSGGLCHPPQFANLFVVRQIDENGTPTASVKTGGTYPDVVGFKVEKVMPQTVQGSSKCNLVYGPDYSTQPITNVVFDLTVDVTGQKLSPKSPGPGQFSFDVTAGGSPALHSLNGQITADADGVTACGDTAPIHANWGVTSMPVLWGLKATVGTITSLDVPDGVDPSRAYLTGDGKLQYPLQVPFSVAPAEYQPRLSDIDLLLNGDLAAVYSGPVTGGQGSVRLEAGYPLDVTQKNQVQATINRNSDPGEVKSDPVDIPLQQKIIIQVRADSDPPGYGDGVDANPAPLTPKGAIGATAPGTITIRNDVDVPNGRACQIAADYLFTIARAATVTLTATPLSDSDDQQTVGTPQKLIDSAAMDKGEHSQLLTPDMFLPRQNGYQLELTATADDGTQETIDTRLIVTSTTHDALPVGQVLVKGVNVKSGRLVVPGQSMHFPGRGPELAFRPTYSSGGGRQIGELGVSWSHNYESSLSVTPCGEVVLSAGDGGSMRFLRNSTGGFTPSKGYHGTLVANDADKSFDFYSKDGTRYHFIFSNPVKRWVLSTITDTNGNALKLEYDATLTDLMLKTVTDANGRTLAITHESRVFTQAGRVANVITKVVGPDNVTLSFEYDDYGNLISNKRLNAGSESYAYSIDAAYLFRNFMTSYSNVLGHATSYQYKYLGKQISMTSVANGAGVLILIPDGTVSRITAADGGTTTFDYQSPGQAGQTTTVTDPVGNTTTYTLNGYGSPLTITNFAGTTTMTWKTEDVLMASKTDPRATTTTYEYDPNGNVTREAVAGIDVSTVSTGTWLGQTSAPYIKSKPQTHVDRNGNTTTYAYDAITGNLMSEARPEGVNLSYAYGSNGDRLAATDGRGKTTRFSYDVSGNPATVTDPLGGLTTTFYDTRGRLKTQTDPNHHTTTFDYDEFDHLRTRTDAKGGLRITHFDAIGNKLDETDEEGRLTTFEYDLVDRLTHTVNPMGQKRITYDPAGNKKTETDWIDQSHITTYAYDGANRLITRTEPKNKITAYGYDGAGNVTGETDANQHLTQHAYDGLNRRTLTTDARGGLTKTTFDGNGNKLTVTDAEGRVTQYTYDGLDRIKTSVADQVGVGAQTAYTYDGNNNVLTVTDPNGHATTNTYDDDNRKTVAKDAKGNLTQFSYDPVGNKKQEQNARGYAKQWDYDELNRVTILTDEEKNQTLYTYDGVGNLKTEQWANGNLVAHTYDALNHRTGSSDKVGALSTHVYDAQGNVTSETDGNGNQTTHSYDELNRRVQTIAPSRAGARTLAFTYDLVNNLKTEKDGNGNVVTHVYDELNRLSTSTDAIGQHYAATYDKVGNKLTETDGGNNIVTHEYDGLNRLTKTYDAVGTIVQNEYDKAGNKIVVRDGRGIATNTAFDELNRPTTVTRSSVLMSTTEYDAVGNVRFLTDALGNKIGYEYDGRNVKTAENKALGAITKFTPNEMGDIGQVLDPEGRTTKNAYDARRRLHTVENNAHEVTTYDYDTSNNRTQVTRPKTNATTYAYDSANRLVGVTTAAGASVIDYDLNGNIVGKTDPNIHTTSYAYDERNRHKKTTYADSTFETRSYDGADNLKTFIDPLNQVTTYGYDARNRERTKTYSTSVDGLGSIGTDYDGANNVTTTTETYASGTRVHQRAYDDFNRLLREIDPWSDTVSRTYDAQGNLTSILAQGSTTRYGYDELNRRTSVTTAPGAITYGYDRTNLPTTITYPNGVVSTTSYDAAMRVAEISHKKGGTALEDTTYTYDHNGNRLTQQRTSSGLTETTTYGYDNSDWLTSTLIVRSDGTNTSTTSVTYTLDGAGNRQREVSVGSGAAPPTASYIKDFTLDARDQVKSVVATGGISGTVNYTYDANGNLIKREQGGATKTYAWDVRDRLVEVDSGAAVLGQYKYNAEGLRDEVVGVRRTTWVNGFAYLDKTPANTLLAKYETSPNGRSPSVVVTNSGAEFLHSDALGSSELSTSATGGVNSTTTFDAWGQYAQTGTTASKFGYTGHELDTGTSLIYFKARHYDPELGRFISADPLDGEPTLPVSWNDYLYANANPTVYIDKNGEAAGTIVGTVGGFFWGFGQMMGGGISDVIDGRSRSTKEYFGIWGQNIIGGAEIGASFDVAVFSGGTGVMLSGALANAGAGALTFSGKGKDANQFAKDQAVDAAIGAVGGVVLSKVGPVVTKVAGVVVPEAVKKTAAKAAGYVADAADSVASRYVRTEADETIARTGQKLGDAIARKAQKLRGTPEKPAQSEPTRMEAEGVGEAQEKPGVGSAGRSTVQSAPAESPSSKIKPVDPAFDPPRVDVPPPGGGKVAGVLHVPGEEPIPLLSGRSGPSEAVRGQGMPGFNGNQLMHVEGHAAAYMRTTGQREAVLDISKVPCEKGSGGGCAGLLPRMLPEGARLRVRGPEGYDQVFVGTPDK
jgi:RHS repeat-associated protein